MPRHAPIGDCVHVRWCGCAAAGRRRAPRAHQLRDEHGIGLVVADVIVVGRARFVVERHEISLRIQPAPHLHRVCRPFGVPRGFLVAHPLHADRPADLTSQKCRLEPGIVGRRAPVALRSVQPDHTHAIARHLEKLRDAVAHAVRLHVVGIDRHLLVRRVRHRMRRADGRVPLERHLVARFDDGCRVRKGGLGIPGHHRPRARRRCRAAHEVEEVCRCRKRRRRRLLPADLELACGPDGVFFTLAHDRDVVAFRHHSDEPGDAAYRRLVDAEQLRACHRRLHVAGVHHARQVDVHGPLQRPIDLGGNVVSFRRLPDHFEILHCLHSCRAGGRVDISAGQRDVEPLAADQFAVGDLFRRIALRRDDAISDGQLIDRQAKLRRRHVEQDSSRFGRHAAHRPAVHLNRI